MKGTDPKAKPENWAEDRESAAYTAATKLYKLVKKAYENQAEQSDRVEEYWNIYNAQPDENLTYTGNTNGYVPVARDCVNARSKRVLKQLFPVSHKHVDGLASDGKIPLTQLALLEHYIRKTQLKATVRSDLIAGDVTGQWNLFVDWMKTTRRTTELVRRNPIVESIDGENVEELGIEDPTADEQEDTEIKDVVDEGPDIVDFAVEDLAVIPPTGNNIQKSQATCLRIRMSAERIQELVDEGVFILPPDTDVKEFVDGTYNKETEKRNRAKKQAEDAGIKTHGTTKFALIFMVYTKLDLGGDTKESAIIYYAGPDEILAIIKNPLWSGKIPILSEPVDRVAGSFYGKSKLEPIKFMQWQLVDFWNMGQDSAMYSLLPVYAADPLKTPQWGSLVIGLAAIWPIAPNDVKQITQPQLWKDAMQMCDGIKRQIWESMDVNEMMMGKTPPGRKNNAMIGNMAQEQATNITDHADRYEEVMLSPLAEMLFEFDQQFRTDSVTIEARGELGVQAKLEEIPPQQWGERYFFRWVGSTYQSNMQRMQQMIAWVNVLKGIPPQMMGGRRLDLCPFLDKGTEDIFGPEMAPRILIDERNMFTVDPDTENAIMHNGMHVQVHASDDDQKHLEKHMQGAQLTGDPQGLYKEHMGQHMLSMQQKREKAQASQGQPGSPGGGPPGAPPGAAGAPRPGAQPAPQRPAQAPPGAIQQDNMAGAPGRG